ncbi:MAG: DUF748 domain-containing protein, partial [Anaerolineae bacterium]|nr:DUF748 domain-containing protein [Anaerolineae bacterium]
VLDTDRVLNLSRLAPESEKPPSAEPAKPLPIHIESISIHDASVAYEDRSGDTPVKHIFEPINIELEHVSTQINALGLSEISILTQDQEKVLIQSQFSFEPLRLQSVIAISNVNLRRANQHLGAPFPVNIQEGRFGLNGRLLVEADADMSLQMQFQGGLVISRLALVDSTRQPVLGFQNLLIPSIDFSLLEQRINLDRIELNGLTMETGLDEHGRLSLLPEEKAPDPTANQPTDADNESDTKEWQFALREFTINNATFKIDDRSIQPPVHMELSELAARLENISNSKDNTTLFQLDTTVNNTSHFHVEGHTKPFADTADLDLRLALEDYDLIKVSPYAGKFIGYEIDRGLLGLIAAYRLQGTTLTAEHDILFSNFTLGADVESPDAIKAPIKLGLSLL